MLCYGRTMDAGRLSRWLPLSLAGLAAAALMSGTACEAEAPPPATPQNDSTDVPPPPPPAPAPLATDAPPAASGDAQYASGEYTVGGNPDAYDDDDPAALTDFHGALDPYGTWVDDGTYGTVWVPGATAVGADFTPYSTAGHWVYGDDWVWASDYPWGWAPFHYGRWVLIEGRGWSWIPGRVYRGAWVGWSVDDGYGYVGWAPLGPAFVWFGGRPVMWRGYGYAPRWVYCARGEVFSPRVSERVLVGPAAARVSGNMHAFVSATPGVAGPAPGRLGYAPSQVPHATGATAQSVARAQTFARPSTAQAAGGSPSVHATSTPAGVASQSARPSLADAHPGQVGQRGTSISTERMPSGPAAARPTTTVATPHPAGAMRAAPPVTHSSPPAHSGGSHHR